MMYTCKTSCNLFNSVAEMQENIDWGYATINKHMA